MNNQQVPSGEKGYSGEAANGLVLPTPTLEALRQGTGDPEADWDANRAAARAALSTVVKDPALLEMFGDEGLACLVSGKYLSEPAMKKTNRAALTRTGLQPVLVDIIMKTLSPFERLGLDGLQLRASSPERAAARAALASVVTDPASLEMFTERDVDTLALGKYTSEPILRKANRRGLRLIMLSPSLVDVILDALSPPCAITACMKFLFN